MACLNRVLKISINSIVAEKIAKEFDTKRQTDTHTKVKQYTLSPSDSSG